MTPVARTAETQGLVPQRGYLISPAVVPGCGTLHSLVVVPDIPQLWYLAVVPYIPGCSTWLWYPTSIYFSVLAMISFLIMMAPDPHRRQKLHWLLWELILKLYLLSPPTPSTMVLGIIYYTANNYIL
jgi:hypothetical protein